MENQKESVSAKISDDLYQAAIRSFNYNAIKVLEELIKEQNLSNVFNTEKYNDESSVTAALNDAALYWKDKNFFIHHLINHYLKKKEKYSIETFMGLTNVLFLINMDIPVMRVEDEEGKGQRSFREDLLGVRRVTRILYPLELSVDKCEAKRQDSAHSWCLGHQYCKKACFRWAFFPWKDVTIFQKPKPVKTQTLGKRGFDEFFKVAQFALADCSYNAALSSPFRREKEPVHIADVLFPALFNQPILFRDMRPLYINEKQWPREILHITRRGAEKSDGERETIDYKCHSGYPEMNYELGIVSEAIIPLRIPDEYYVQVPWNNPLYAEELGIEKHGIIESSIVVELYSPIPDWFAYKIDESESEKIDVKLIVWDKNLEREYREKAQGKTNAFWCPLFPKHCRYGEDDGMTHFIEALSSSAAVIYNLFQMAENRSYEFFRWLLASLRSTSWGELPVQILQQYLKDEGENLNTPEFKKFVRNLVEDFTEWAKERPDIVPSSILGSLHVGMLLSMTMGRSGGFSGKKVVLKDWPEKLSTLGSKAISKLEKDGKNVGSLRVSNELLKNCELKDCEQLDWKTNEELKKLSNYPIFIGPMEKIITEIINNVIQHGGQSDEINIHMCLYNDFTRCAPAIHIVAANEHLEPDEYMLLKQGLPKAARGIGIMANRYSVEGGIYKSGEYIVNLGRPPGNSREAAKKLSSRDLLASEYRRGLHTWILIKFDEE